MDFRHGRFDDQVKKISTRATQTDNRNALTSDTVLNRCYVGPCLKCVGYVEGVGYQESG